MQGMPSPTVRQRTPPGERLLRHAILLLLLASLALLPMLSEATVVIDGRQPQTELSSLLQSLRDDTGRLTVSDLLDESTPWKPATGRAVNLGIDHHDWWFRVDLQNDHPSLKDFLLEIAYPSLDHVAVYLIHGGELIDRHLLGDHRPHHERPINHHYFVIPTRLPKDGTVTLLLHVRTNGVVQLPLTLWEKTAFASHDQARQLIAGVYFGAMLVMLIYNLFMYIGIGDRSYLYYVGFVLSVPLFVSSLTGYSFQYFWPEAIYWNGQSIGFFLSSTVIFALLFTMNFLQLHRDSLSLWVRNSFRVVTLVATGMMVSVFVVPYNTMLVLVMGGSVIGCMAALGVGFYCAMRGERPALFYVPAWGALLMGGLILAASKLTLLPQNVFTDNAVQIGSILLVVLLSFALAERINDERRRRYRAQMEALQNERRARLAQEQALNAQTQANLQLEQKVAERTEELAKANTILQELSDTDALTGMRNRRFLDNFLDREVTRCFRYQHPLAVILLDIDHFKRFNDHYGHQIGDDCLRMVADQLRHCVARDSDVVARYGGEEFCVVLPETELEGARAVAERIRRRIGETPFQITDEKVQVTVSVGVTCMVPNSPKIEARLLQRADEALYQAKGDGRNRVVCLPGDTPGRQD
ncbi:MAG: diguanylate cyclase [Alcanivoracaceae bacterium]